MKYNLPGRVEREIISYAKINGIRKVILFGSRAKGTNTEKSDIDLAVCGGNFDSFYWNMKKLDSFIPAFCVLEETLKKKLDEAGADWG